MVSLTVQEAGVWVLLGPCAAELGTGVSPLFLVLQQWIYNCRNLGINKLNKFTSVLSILYIII